MSEIRSTGSQDQILGWDPHIYDAPERDPDAIFQWLRDEEENDFWCATEPPEDNLIAIIERAS